MDRKTPKKVDNDLHYVITPNDTLSIYEFHLSLYFFLIIFTSFSVSPVL